MTSANTSAHGHSHAPAAYGRAFAIGVALNLVFVAVEALWGWRVHSLALLADAGHNLSDVGGLLLAWAGMAASRLRPNDRHSYGWRRASILASFANALILLVVMGSLGLAALQRLKAPVPVEGGVVMLVASIGVIINAITAALFSAGKAGDLNIRGAYLHMAADALVSAGVVLAGALYLWQGWAWIDPVVTLGIVVVVVVGTWSLFRQSLHLLFDGVPAHVDLAKVRETLLTVPGIASVHDVHVWALSTSEVALSAHAVQDGGAAVANSTTLHSMATRLHDEHGIEHMTVQLETASEPCPAVHRDTSACV